MGIPGSANPLLLAQQDTQYTVSRSLRFNSSDSAYCSRVQSTAGNLTKWTWAGWVKLAAFNNTYPTLISGGDATYRFFVRYLTSNGAWEIYTAPPNGGLAERFQTVSSFRDFSAWAHYVLVWDTSNATATDRCRFYVNGSLQQLTGTFSQNVQSSINNNSEQLIGKEAGYSRYLDGYLAECHFCDGYAYDPSYFTETNAVTGQLIPKKFTGSYGSQGWYLNFADNSGTTATTLGKDSSGNSNNWTPNNLSVTAGAGNDSLVDTPTSYGTDAGNGGEIRGNYCTWNPLLALGATLSNGNLDCSTSGSGNATGGTVSVSSGKWYWEVTPTSSNASVVGILAAGIKEEIGSSATSYGYKSNATKVNSNSSTSYGASFTSGDVIGVALDLDNGTLAFYKNGSSQGTAFSSLSGTFTPAFSRYTASETSCSANFGQRSWAYAAPSGFKALCDTNLPAPVVAKSSTVFDTKLYTGNGSTQNITGLGFSPDLVWIKDRSAGYFHNILDTIRGGNARLSSNNTDAENTGSAGGATPLISTFNSDGFTFPNGNVNVNGTSTAYVGWCWDAGSSTVTNTQGSITSSVRANASAGFSVVTYAGNSTAGATVGHGLNVAPSLIIVKSRTGTAGYLNWGVYHASLGNTKALYLNTTGAESADSNEWNNTSPTSTVFSLGFTSGNGHNISGQNYVAYCWAPLSGYSSFGSYTGNGNVDGPLIYTGFRPALVILKMSSSINNWVIIDCKRIGYNANNYLLFPDTADAEVASVGLMDITSNGFKIRTTSTGFNTNTATYIYAAWAEFPFQYARAR